MREVPGNGGDEKSGRNPDSPIGGSQSDTSQSASASQSTSASQTEHDAKIVTLLTEIQLPLMLYVRSILPVSSMAKDVSQQANVKIWEKRNDFQLGTNFKAWAFSIARFEVLNFRKQQARDARLMFSPDLQDAITAELLERQGDVRPMHDALRGCLTTLKQKEKQLLLHRYACADTLANYAREVGRSVGGLKVTLHRLRNKLLDCIHRKLASQ